MRWLLSHVVAAALPTLSTVAVATVEGRIVNENGAAVVGARIEVVDEVGASTVEHAVTSHDGRFVLRDVATPVDLHVTHPRYATAVVELAADGARPVEVTLRRRLHYEDDVTVRGRSLGDRFSPGSVASTAVVPRDAAAPPSAVAEAVAGVAGVAVNGQGGLFQVVSVRGVSGQRVLSHVGGARITSERRAGVALSFLDPTLVGEIDVQRGAASTYYGSGALGGALQVLPRRFELLSAELGYGSQGDERWLAVGRGGPRWSTGVAHRRRTGGETGNDARLHDGFAQTSLTAEAHFGADRKRAGLSALVSFGEDIGKSNRDFPERTTTYPRERHLTLGFETEAAAWRAKLWVHPQDLRTEVTGAVSRDVVENESFDFGLLWERTVALGPRGEGRFGVDAFSRRGVDALQLREPHDGGEPSELGSLRDGEKDELAALGVTSWRWGRVRLEAGGRGTFVHQSAAGKESERGSHLTGFAGVAIAAHRRLELRASLGRAFRVASLSERFFSGTTGRGEVVGNPDLEPESALDAELGLRFVGDRFVTGVALYRNRVADYIERIEVDPGLFTFRNLTSGTLEGMELSGLVGLPRDWSLSFAAHRIRGRDDGGRVLADLPADRLRVEPRFSGSRFRFAAALALRRARSEVSDTEEPIGSAVLLELSLGWRLARELDVFLVAENLLDELYLPTADSQAAPAPGRSVGVRLAWRGR